MSADAGRTLPGATRTIAGPTSGDRSLRLLMLVAGLAIPLFGLLRLATDRAESPPLLAVRGLLTLVCLGQVVFDPPARWRRPAALGTAWLVLAWFLVSGGLEAWQGANMTLMQTVSLSAMRTRQEIGSYLVFCVAMIGVTWALDPDPVLSAPVLATVSVVVGVAVGGVQLGRVRLEAELERRVADRTHLLAESLVRLEEEVRVRTAAEAEARRADVAKSAFLANMSHELRTPLTAILGYTELLQEELDADAAPDLERVRSSAHHLLALVDDVLDLARIDAGRVVIERRVCALAELLAPVVAELRPAAEAKGLALSVDVPPGLAVRTDPLRLRQILTNLLSNAVKFTARGQLRVVAEARDDRVRVAVSDTGPGIAPEVLATLFQRFVQADPSSTRAHGGTGLGLAISRELVTLLGGELTAESEVGVGSTFVVHLPV